MFLIISLYYCGTLWITYNPRIVEWIKGHLCKRWRLQGHPRPSTLVHRKARRFVRGERWQRLDRCRFYRLPQWRPGHHSRHGQQVCALQPNWRHERARQFRRRRLPLIGRLGQHARRRGQRYLLVPAFVIFVVVVYVLMYLFAFLQPIGLRNAGSSSSSTTTTTSCSTSRRQSPASCPTMSTSSSGSFWSTSRPARSTISCRISTRISRRAPSHR